MKIQLLPTTRKEITGLGWDQADIVLVTADAYVDHPSFGAALIGRWLARHNFKVAILAQPDWHSADDFRAIGPPRLFWAITSGCIDSRLNMYASMGSKRREDLYSPGG
ncbi:MAG: YgiQ family radical SAM protein, partial [Planctomycetota bacterium]